MPETIDQATGAVRTGGTTALNLSGRRLRTVRDSIRGLTSITKLDLSGNHITHLPDWLGELTALTHLALTGNRLMRLPESIGQLTALTALNLAANQLTVLPESIGRLTALRTLLRTDRRLRRAVDRRAVASAFFHQASPATDLGLCGYDGEVEGPDPFTPTSPAGC